MTWLVETPWPSVALGLVLEIILAIALVRTGRGTILVAMVLVLALTGGLVVLERVVVTQTEEVENALDAVAASLEANDAAAVLAGFTSNSPRRGEVQAALARVTVKSAHVGGDLEVRFNELTIPPSASAYFTGVVEAHDRSGTIPYERMMRRFKVTLHRQGDRWLIHDFSEPESRGQRGP